MAAKKRPARDIPNTNEIVSYLHCSLCLRDFKNNAATTFGESPASYQRIEVGFTPIGLQVWCRRHDKNIVHIDFEGQKHPANTTRKKE